MSDWLGRILNSRTSHAVQLAAHFAEERQKVLAENVANIDTPDYQSKRLDAKAFQRSLRAAISDARASGERQLQLRGDAQVRTDAEGRMHVEPELEPAANALFHDGTNARLDTLLSDASENAMLYNVASSLLKNHLDIVLTSIRGRVS